MRAYVWRCRKRVDPSAFLLRKGTAYKSPERGGGSRIKKRPGRWYRSLSRVFEEPVQVEP